MGASWNAPAGVPWSPDVTLGDIAGLQSPAGSPLGTSDQQAAITGLQNQTPQPPPPTPTGNPDPGSTTINGTTPMDQYGNALNAGNPPPGSMADVFNQMGGFQLEPFDFAKRYGEYNTALQNAYQSSMRPHLDPSTRPGLLANLLTFGMAGAAHSDYEAGYNAQVDAHNANMHAAAARDALNLTAQDATYHAAGLNRQMQMLGIVNRMSNQDYGNQLKWISTYKDFLRPPPSPDEAEMLANNGRYWQPIMGGQGMIFDKNGPVAPIYIPPPPNLLGRGGMNFPGGGGWPGTVGAGGGGGYGGQPGLPGGGGGGGYGGPTGHGAAPVRARPVNPQSPYGRAANDNPTGSAPGKDPTQNAANPGGAAPSDPTTTTTTTAPPTTAGGTTGSTTGTTLPTTENRAIMEGTKKEAQAFATAKGKSKEQFEASAKALENSLNNPDFNKFVNNLLPANVGRSTPAGILAVQKSRAYILAQRAAGNDPAKLVDLNNMRRQLDNIIANIGIQGGRSSSGMRLSMQMIEKFEGQWQQLASGNMSREMAQAFRASVLKEIQNARKAIDDLQWVPPSQRGQADQGGGGGGALAPGATGTLSSGRKFTINP